MSPRTLMTSAAAVTAVVVTLLAPVSAQAADETSDVGFRVQTYQFPESGLVGAWVSIESKQKDRAFAFHTWSRAELHHCDGTVSRTYGTVSATKQGAKAWRTTTAVDLDFDPTQGPYEKWVVTLHSKGRPDVSTTITSTDVFTLGCAGEYSANPLIQRPTTATRKPLTANYSVSATRALAARATFGRVTGLRKGKVAVGSSVGVAQAGRVVKGKLKGGSCRNEVELKRPGRPRHTAGISLPCGLNVVVPKRTTFNTPTGTTAKRYTVVGKPISLTTTIMLDGHSFARRRELGKVVAR